MFSAQIFRDVYRWPFVVPAQDVGRFGRRRRQSGGWLRACGGDGGQFVLGVVAGRSVGRFGWVGVCTPAVERRPVPPARPAHRVHQFGRQPVSSRPRGTADQGHTGGTGQIPVNWYAPRRELVVPVMTPKRWWAPATVKNVRTKSRSYTYYM